MAKKKSSKKSTRKSYASKASRARRSPRKARRSSGKRSSPRRVKQAGFGDVAMELLKGAAGAVLVVKVAPALPTPKDPFLRNLLLCGGSIAAAVYFPKVRSFAIGAGISSGVMAASAKFPELMRPFNLQKLGIGRVSPETYRQLQQGAMRVQRTMNGGQQRTIIGTGEPGYRGRTIVGAGAFGY